MDEPVEQVLQQVLGQGYLEGGVDNEGWDFRDLETFLYEEPESPKIYIDEQSKNRQPVVANGDCTSIPVGQTPTQVKCRQNSLYNRTTALPQPYSQCHLPDSPPDSGSEPPFSPDDQDAKSSHSVSNFIIARPAAPIAPSSGHNSLPSVHVVMPSPEQSSFYSPSTGKNPKKRRLSDSSSLTSHVKEEPDIKITSHTNGSHASFEDSVAEYGNMDLVGEGVYVESPFQCIRFHPFHHHPWHALMDSNLKDVPPPNYRVDADKGFNYSNQDESFVCQKKNHFQVTVHLQAVDDCEYVRTAEGIKKITGFYIHIFGVKVESPSQTIKVEQSKSDRSKRLFNPIQIDVSRERVNKVTIGRLHFSETTTNNMRKKGKPNPDQRYFHLVVALHAHFANSSYPVVSHASEKIIVRASNPGQFDNDMELCWQKGQTPESVFHAGKVGINMDRPDEALVIHGNLKLTGSVMQPSDERIKGCLSELDSRQQLKNVQSLRLVKFKYSPEYSQYFGTPVSDAGVIAQQVRQVIPEAVKSAGDLSLPTGKIDNFLVVNKDRIFMENVGAVKELCKVTDTLETRIEELERMSKKLARLKRNHSLKSTSSSSTVTSHCSNISPEKKSSNRVMQAIMTVLLLVMAFCLVAMVVLYFLEWQKRQEHQHPLLNLSPTTIRSVSHNEIVTSSSPKSALPSKSGPNYKSSWALPRASTFTRIVTPSALPPVVGKPDNCDDTIEYSCQRFCCSCVEVRNQGLSPSSTNARTYRTSEGSRSMVETVTEQHINSLEGVGKSNKLAAATYRQSRLLEYRTWSQKRHKRESDALQGLGSPATSKALTLPGLEEQRVEMISIEELGMNVTEEYCIGRCRSENNNTYELLLSPYMPHHFLTIIFHFNMLSEARMSQCEPTLSSQQCPCTSHQPSTPQPSEMWKRRVDAGAWLYRTYRFRVPKYTDEEDVCGLPVDEAGLKYTEYNLSFRRSCDE